MWIECSIMTIMRRRVTSPPQLEIYTLACQVLMVLRRCKGHFDPPDLVVVVHTAQKDR